MDDLLAARDLLKNTLEKSRNIAIAVEQTSSRLTRTSHSVSYLQAAITDVSSKCSVYKIRAHVDRAIGPSSAVLKVLGLVHELEDSLDSDPRTLGLTAYLTNTKRLHEALKLLADNCRLVALWMEDVFQILEREEDGDEWYSVRVSKVMRILDELQGNRESRFLSSALDNLEREFERLVGDSLSLAPQVIEELRGIVEVLAANNRLEKCVAIYAEARIRISRASLRALCAKKYLDIELSESVTVQTVDIYIDQWEKHVEFAVGNLLREEHVLCSEVFRKIGSDEVRMSCFEQIATRCGFVEIFDFGAKVCECKKEAIKLLSLLKIFSALDKLRLRFNEVFGGRFCSEIQNRTRDLVKKVVDGICEIFWDLSVQVELQRAYGPPPDGGVPRLVCFVTEYCNRLLEGENSLILARVLEIHNNRVRSKEGLLSFEIHNVMKALEINLETWAESCGDRAFSCVFMMNSHWYLYNNVRGTKLGELMGDSWLSAYEESIEYYAELYIRASWGKIPVLLREEGLIMFPGGRAVDRDLVRTRVRIFCEAVDDMCKRQSRWVMSDEALRWKTCRMVAETIVPPYKEYLQRFVIMAGSGHDMDEVKYSAESLESLIGRHLLHPKLGMYGNGSKCTDLIGVIKNADLNHFSPSPAGLSEWLLPRINLVFYVCLRCHLRCFSSLWPESK